MASNELDYFLHCPTMIMTWNRACQGCLCIQPYRTKTMADQVDWSGGLQLLWIRIQHYDILRHAEEKKFNFLQNFVLEKILHSFTDH